MPTTEIATIYPRIICEDNHRFVPVVINSNKKTDHWYNTKNSIIMEGFHDVDVYSWVDSNVYQAITVKWFPFFLCNGSFFSCDERFSYLKAVYSKKYEKFIVFDDLWHETAKNFYENVLLYTYSREISKKTIEKYVNNLFVRTANAKVKKELVEELSIFIDEVIDGNCIKESKVHRLSTETLPGAFYYERFFSSKSLSGQMYMFRNPAIVPPFCVTKTYLKLGGVFKPTVVVKKTCMDEIFMAVHDENNVKETHDYMSMIYGYGTIEIMKNEKLDFAAALEKVHEKIATNDVESIEKIMKYVEKEHG